jgi:hypothetical protein
MPTDPKTPRERCEELPPQIPQTWADPFLALLARGLRSVVALAPENAERLGRVEKRLDALEPLQVDVPPGGPMRLDEEDDQPAATDTERTEKGWAFNG